MAKAREILASNPLVESEEEESEEEESEEEGSEEEGSESESEPEGPANGKKPSTTPTSAAVAKKSESQTAKLKASLDSSSEEDEESGSETDTDSPTKKVESSIKPIASKPMSEPEKEKATATKKLKSKPSSPGPASPTRAASLGAKRPAPATPTPTGDVDVGGKRSKRKLVVENSEKKATPFDEGKKLFVRVWSEDDEIAVLKGMIEYKAKKKIDPVADFKDFHEFIRNKIKIEVSRTQLQDKIRRLKKKYVNNAAKEKNGKERTFSNPHEQKTYELSRQIWGSKINVEEETPEAPKANGTAVKKSRTIGSLARTPKIEEAEADEEVNEEEKSSAAKNNKSFSYVSDGRAIDEWVFNDGTELLKEDDRADLEKQWKKLRTEEAGVLVKRLEISHAHAKKVYEALKSSG